MKDKKKPKAVALKYRPQDDMAPRVVASGQGHLAEKMIALAREHQIPLYEDKHLADLLEELDLNVTIPPELYRAVAEVLAFIYRLDRSKIKS